MEHKPQSPAVGAGFVGGGEQQAPGPVGEIARTRGDEQLAGQLRQREWVSLAVQFSASIVRRASARVVLGEVMEGQRMMVGRAEEALGE